MHKSLGDGLPSGLKIGKWTINRFGRDPTILHITLSCFIAVLWSILRSRFFDGLLTGGTKKFRCLEHIKSDLQGDCRPLLQGTCQAGPSLGHPLLSSGNIVTEQMPRAKLQIKEGTLQEVVHSQHRNLFCFLTRPPKACRMAARNGRKVPRHLNLARISRVVLLLGTCGAQITWRLQSRQSHQRLKYARGDNCLMWTVIGLCVLTFLHYAVKQ